MAIITSDLGAQKILDAFFNQTSNDLTLKLFTNDITPTDTNVAGDFTEAAGGGYAAKTLSAGSWTDSVTGGIAQVAYAKQTFTFTGALNGGASIYGYYVIDGAGTLIYSEKRNAGAFTPIDNGDYYEVTPVYKGSKGTPS